MKFREVLEILLYILVAALGAILVILFHTFFGDSFADLIKLGELYDH